MKVFLIRHGETSGNVAHRHQAEDSSLTKKGVAQVQEAAEVLRQYEPTHLLTSRLVRAVETARIIGATCDLVPETSEHFIELERPKFLYGHFHVSLRSVFFYFLWYLGLRGQAPREGESYAALRARFKAAEQQLATYPADARVAVVSHSAFINLFVAHLCREGAVGPFKIAQTFWRMHKMPNAHIVPLHFDTEVAGTCSWSLE